MKRIYCDGCYKAGIMTDLTGRNDYAQVPFLGNFAEMLDLCPERCLPLYTEFEHRIKGQMHSHKDEFQQQMRELIEAFWREVESGGKEKAVIHASKSGRPFWASE